MKNGTDEIKNMVLLNIAYHSARILVDCVASNSIKTEDGQKDLETLIINLAADLAELNGKEDELIAEYPQFYTQGNGKCFSVDRYKL